MPKVTKKRGNPSDKKHPESIADMLHYSSLEQITCQNNVCNLMRFTLDYRTLPKKIAMTRNIE